MEVLQNCGIKGVALGKVSVQVSKIHTSCGNDENKQLKLKPPYVQRFQFKGNTLYVCNVCKEMKSKEMNEGMYAGRMVGGYVCMYVCMYVLCLYVYQKTKKIYIYCCGVINWSKFGFK